MMESKTENERDGKSERFGLLDWEESEDSGKRIDGVSLEFLMEWAMAYPDFSTEDVCEKLKGKIRQASDEHGCSYLDILRKLKPEHVGTANLFLCHEWSGNFQECIMAVNQHFNSDPSVKAESTFIWVDIICANQLMIDRAASSEEGTIRIAQDTKRIIRLVGQTIAVITSWENESVNLLSRAWCVWELLCTPPQKLLVAQPQKERRAFIADLHSRPGEIISSVNRMESNLTEATKTVDMDVLHNIFDKCQGGGFQVVNKAVKAHFFRWIAEYSWELLIDSQKNIEREYGADQKSSPKRKSLRNLLRTQAIFLRDVANGFKAHKLYNYSIELYLGLIREHAKFKSQTDYEKITAINYSNLADCYSESGSYELAAQYYEKALEINRKLEPALVPDTLNGIANNLWHLGRYKEAEENFVTIIKLDRQSYEREKTSRMKRCLVTSLFNMGNHLEISDGARAVPFLEEAVTLGLELYPEDESEETIQETRDLAALFFSLGQFEKAIEYITKLLVIQDFAAVDESNESTLELKIPDKDEEDENEREDFEGVLGDDLAVLAKSKLHLAQSIENEEEKLKILNEAVIFARAAYDLHSRKHGESSPVVLADLRLLVRFEELRGNQDRAGKLSARAEDLASKSARQNMRSGPLSELEVKSCEQLELKVPELSANVKTKKNFEEVADVFEILGNYHLSKRETNIKGIKYLCEATKLRLFYFGTLKQAQQQQRMQHLYRSQDQNSKLSDSSPKESSPQTPETGNINTRSQQTTPNMEWKISAIEQDVRNGLIRLFHLFSSALKEEALVQPCASFVKMVQFFYNDASTDNLVLAQNLFGSLLHTVKREEEAVAVYKDALVLAEKVYKGKATKQWLSVLQNASLVYKSRMQHQDCLKLQKRVLAMYNELNQQQDEQSASNLYQVAKTQVNFANSLLAASGSATDEDGNELEAQDLRTRLLSQAEQNLLQGISILQRLREVSNEENIAILRRELTDLYIVLERYEEALEEVQQVINLHDRVYETDDPNVAADLNVLKWVSSKIKRKSRPAGEGKATSPKSPQENAAVQISGNVAAEQPSSAEELTSGKSSPIDPVDVSLQPTSSTPLQPPASVQVSQPQSDIASEVSTDPAPLSPSPDSVDNSGIKVSSPQVPSDKSESHSQSGETPFVAPKPEATKQSPPTLPGEDRTGILPKTPQPNSTASKPSKACCVVQ